MKDIFAIQGRHCSLDCRDRDRSRLDSRSPMINTIYGDVLRLAGLSNSARLQLEHTLAMDPDVAYALSWGISTCRKT